MPKATDPFKPGRRVRVTQQIAQRDEVWTHVSEGVVVRAEQAKTASWFAHARDARLWLDRLVLRKDDGEIVVLNLDQYTHADVIAEPPAEADATPLPQGERPNSRVN